eukprot:3999833-Prymnesium_polylepis.1
MVAAAVAAPAVTAGPATTEDASPPEVELLTEKSGGSANYSGCFWDAIAHGDGAVITAIHFTAGTGGSVRIFATRSLETHAAAMLDWRRWVLVASVELTEPSSWERSVRVPLSTAVPIPRGSTRGLHIFVNKGVATTEALEPGSTCARDNLLELQAGAGYSGLASFFAEPNGCWWREGRSPAGGVSYVRASLPTLTRAQLALDETLTSLDDMQPRIGPTNRMLIREWKGRAVDPPLLSLDVPPSPSHPPLA